MNFLCCSLAVAVLVVFAVQTPAAIITFDSTITSPAPPTANGSFSLDYHTPTLTPPNTLATQGFSFNGLTAGVTGSSNTQPQLSIILDPTQCPSLLGVSCVSDGTHFLGTEDPFGLFPQGGGHFSIGSFDASMPFSAFCAECNDGMGLANASVLNVVGFRSGVQVAAQTFDLTFGFETLTLTNPNWADVTRVVFQPLTAAGGPGGVAIDNITAAAIPEPAALTLTGLGLVGIITRYRRRRSRPRRD